VFNIIFKRIQIITNSQATLKHCNLLKYVPKQLKKVLDTCLARLSEHNKIYLRWTKGHQNSEGNVIVNLLVKKVYRARTHVLFVKIMTLLKKQHDLHWNGLLGMVQTRMFLRRAKPKKEQQNCIRW